MGLLRWMPKELPGCVGGGGGGYQSLQPDEGEGKRKGKEGRAQGSAELVVAQRGTGLFWLCSRFLGETSTLKLCATGEVTSVSRQGNNGEEGKSWGERVPHFLCTEASVTAPTLGAASLGAEAPCHVPVPPLVLASLVGHLPRQKSRGRRRRKDSGARPATALPAESGGRQRQDTQGKGGRWRSGSPRGVGWALFLLLSLPRGGSLADFLDQLLIRQAVEAVDGQVRDEVLTGFAGDLFATPQVDEGDVGDAAQVQQGLVRQLIAACGQSTGSVRRTPPAGSTGRRNGESRRPLEQGTHLPC